MKTGSLVRRATGAALLGAALLVFPGCPEHQLSGQELQALKREAVQKNQGKLTPEEEFRIGVIRARTRSEFDRELERILKGSHAPAGGAQ